jgi:UDP-3-O-[3-hydroxymyristoyl] N-acetylglucosamine deacetylase
VDRSRQGTIGEAVRLEGIGLHTGRLQRITLRPAPPDTGILFRRTDLGTPSILGAGRSIRATLDAVSGTAGRISLGGEDGVQTVEHLLSAAWAAGVDNLEVEIEGTEVPGMDGSALPFVRALRAAGVRSQDAARPALRVREPVWVGNGHSLAVALPAPRFRVACLVTLDAPSGEDQAATYDPVSEQYEEVIAPARTWGYERDAETLRRQGLALGASLENTLVIGGAGYLNPPRFHNEAARHKILDLLGDLALLGGDIQGHVIAVRAGHSLHVALARALRDREG